MNERMRILELLAEGKLTPGEAERLLEAVKAEERQAAVVAEVRESGTERGEPGGKAKPSVLRVLITKRGGETVNVRVPLGLLRAGIKLKGLLPDSARSQVDVAFQEKGLRFNLDELDGKALEGIIQALQETSIHVDAEGETVRVFCE